jgi:hypothetical protein
MSYVVAKHSGDDIYDMNCLAYSNAGVMGLNPAQGMDVCMHFSVFV